MKPGVSIQDFISTKFSRMDILRGAVCMCVSEKVLLGCSFIEISWS